MNRHPIIILSPPENVLNEIPILIQLFEHGLNYFHLRKPNFSRPACEAYIQQIPQKYWNRIILHQFHTLANELNLGGIHLTESHRIDVDILEYIQPFQAKSRLISAAIHQLEDLELLGQICDYVLISPVFDSISKKDYKANSTLSINTWKGKTKAKLIALGGVHSENAKAALERGFEGVAVLGHIWQEPENALQNFHQLQQAVFKPYVLSIAGFDPSAGAGLLADIKTFEQLQTYGLGVCSALTIQNDTTFKATNWVSEAEIFAQIEVLKERFNIQVVKIGLIENWYLLEKIIHLFKGKPIVFDPILKASAGFDFHKEIAFGALTKSLSSLSLITPNREEIVKLLPNKSPEEAAITLSQYCPVLLKGGHHKTRIGEDELWESGKCIAVFEAKKVALRSKHGSGCVLSSAIAAYLAQGEGLVSACKKGKTYVEAVLNSNETLLGYHHS